jgi:hypothetical protein
MRQRACRGKVIYVETRRKKTFFIQLSWICSSTKNRDISVNSQAIGTKMNALHCSSCRGSNAGPFPCKGNVITTTLHEPRYCGIDILNYEARSTQNERGPFARRRLVPRKQLRSIEYPKKHRWTASKVRAVSIRLNSRFSSRLTICIRWLRHSLLPSQVHVSSTSILLFPSSL